MSARDAFYFAAGIGFLALAKGKHTLRGYASPKPFDMTELERCIDYDKRVVDEWLQALARYHGSADLAGKNVLELGPGSDLGVGLFLLARGAAQYNACDVNNLVARTPPDFYEALFARLQSRTNGLGAAADVGALRAELDNQRNSRPSRLNYVVRPDFDLVAAVGPGSIDQVFSQAAFEHFDDIDTVVRQLTQVCRPGARIVAEIDLKTHSRWIRDRDPNNIYRYPDALYNLFHFRGIPNRVRPHQYEEAFARHGWRNIQANALAMVGNGARAPSAWSRRFQADVNRMDCLSIMFCATRGP